MKQTTLKDTVKLAGRGLHTGQEVSVSIYPAKENHGIIFKLKSNHEICIPATIHYVDDLVRGTTLSKDGIKIYTVEHLMSAFYGLGIDNALVEVVGNEIPILDGSSKPWIEAFLEVGIASQDSEKVFWEITEPISLTKGDRSIAIFPHESFKITCTSTDDRKTHTQYLSLEIDPEVYRYEIANARTFTAYEDIEPLIKMGKIKGGTLDCAIVIKNDKILSNEPLRYTDEFVRHKILDIIGDLALLGNSIKGHVIAVKTGHALNAELVKMLWDQEQQEIVPEIDTTAEALLDIQDILKRLPHRYPFVLVDRVLSATQDSLIAIKNVTVNEPCFTGHFPENPVFPGVLQLEAMAQAAGLLMGIALESSEKTTAAYFMSADKVKFRHIVQPGDQLRIEVKLLKIKNNRIGQAAAECFVGEKIVSSAELMFMIANKN